MSPILYSKCLTLAARKAREMFLKLNGVEVKKKTQKIKIVGSLIMTLQSFTIVSVTEEINNESAAVDG